ncbi:MAG: pyrimidine 5'-nucleotidase [Chloroflexota bacterium]|nr:pyrimidine 5'-nucleotidase [Chloroflexota bacterium]
MTQIQYLLFDLDDTLYTNASGLFAHVRERIDEWLIAALEVSNRTAGKLRDEYYQQYGTTMAGLLQHHPGVDIDDYLDYVHEFDVAPYLQPNPQLAEILEQFSQPKVIFTNAIASWAEKVLMRLGIRSYFTELIDVRAVDYLSKPRPAAYELALARLNVPGSACILLDDQPRNLKAAAEFDIRTVLVRSGGEVEPGIDFAVSSIMQIQEPLRILTNAGSKSHAS